MSPKLLGPYRQAMCKECGHSWKIAAETLGSDRHPVVCDICRSKCTIGELQPGQQVTAQRFKSNTAPQRLDCIVYQSQLGVDHAANDWACKRIWGLPGESIEFLKGDIVIDGQLYQKDVKQMLQVAIPVASYPGNRADLFSLPQPSSGETDRLPSAQTLAGKASTLVLDTGEIVQWSHPVVDDYSEDFSTPRNLIAVNDLLFDIEFEDHRDSQEGNYGTDRKTLDQSPRFLVLNFEYYGVQVEIQCQLGHASPDIIPDLPVNTRGARNTLFNPQRICFGGWDGQLYCVVNENISVLHFSPAPADSQPERAASTATQFSMTILNGPVRIKKLAVMRDLYLRPNERDMNNGLPEPTQLGADEFFVIGDNLPISIDSRNGLGNLRRQQVWGVIQ